MEGLMNENGPFTMNKKGTGLGINPYSWNRVATTLYLEAPAGVGFSYSTEPSDLTTGDAQTATDMLQFLLNFFNVFTTLNNGQFLYLTGESYAGHYVPNLAAAISEYNTHPNRFGGLTINLRGMLIGTVHVM